MKNGYFVFQNSSFSSTSISFTCRGDRQLDMKMEMSNDRYHINDTFEQSDEDDDFSYDYNESKKYNPRKNKCLFVLYCIVPIYLIGVIAYLVHFCIREKTPLISNACHYQNVTMNNFEYISLIVSRNFLDSFDIGPSASLHDKERRLLTQSILSNFNLYVRNEQLNSPICLDFYVENILNNSKVLPRYSEELCKFRNSLDVENVPFEIYINNTDAMYRNYVYMTKTFCNAYILLLYNRFSSLENYSEKLDQNILFGALAQNNILFLFSAHLLQFIKTNKICTI